MNGAALSIPHPLTDAADADWVATQTHAEVVPLTVAMSDFLHRVTADRRRPLIVTGPHSRLTEPLREALTAVGGHWVVRTGVDSFYDARTGRALSRAADVLAPRSADDRVAAEFLRSAAATRMQIVTTFSTRHRANAEIQLGGVAESLSSAFHDAPPMAWGATEPVVAPWNRPQLTEYSRRRMPDESRWIVAGDDQHPMIGTIVACRTSEGVEETTRLSVDRGAAGDERHSSLAEDAAEALRRAAAHAMPLIGLAIAHPGAPDLAARPLMAVPPQPLALVIGPAGLRRLHVDARDWTADLGGQLVGRPRLPSALIPLGSADGGGWERVKQVFDSLDASLTADALGVGAWLRPDASDAHGGGADA